MRGRLKEWKNGKYPKWTCRIIWYEEGDGENIRLQLTDKEQEYNCYPKNSGEADIIWNTFKEMAVPGATSVITNMLQLFEIADQNE